MEIKQLATTFQAVISKFTAERDDAVAKISRLLNEGGVDVEKELTKQIRLLTLSKSNILCTKEEFDKIIELDKQGRPPEK